MKRIAWMIVLSACLPAAGALAADAKDAPDAAAAGGASCTAQADGKKLAGAARTSFMKRCSADAQMSCGTEAQSRKLAGAAKSSFTKKCARDAIGAPA